MRLNIKLSDELAQKLEKYALEFGMTKSGFVSYALANHIHNLDKQGDIYAEISQTMSKIASDVIKNQEKGDSNDVQENIYY